MKFEVSFYKNGSWHNLAQFVDFDMACEFANQLLSGGCITSLETGEILWES